MLLIAIALWADPGQIPISISAVEHMPSLHVPTQVQNNARVSVRILHAARAGQDFEGQNQPGSRRRSIIVEGKNGVPERIQAIEFE